jgi:transcriptional regulator GlxA family with amidase domain
MDKGVASPRRIGFIVFPGVTALDFVGPMDAFAAAVIEGAAKKPYYELITIGVTRGYIKGESGVEFRAQHTLESAPPCDTVLVSGGEGLRKPATLEKVSTWLRARVSKTRRIASVCTGIYGLAASGLLDGRDVTTHWAFAHDVVQRFPRLKVDANALFIKDGKFYTSAGVTAGIDLALALIEEDCGPTVALAVARELVVYLKRPGDQAQYSEPLRFQARSSDRFADLAVWISRNLYRRLSTETLAQRTHLGVRHFSRDFKRSFGVTPAQFVERQRIQEACRRLLLPRASVESVAVSVGFMSADAFRRAFERCMGTAPSLYRARFTSSHK